MTRLQRAFLLVALFAVWMMAYFLPRVLSSISSDTIYGIKAMSTELPGNKELLPQILKHDQCSYKVQLFDKNEQLIKPNWVLPGKVRKSRKGPYAQFDVSCGSTCNISLIIADETNKFAGMDAVVFHLLKHLYPNLQHQVDTKLNQALVYFSRESPRTNHRQDKNLRNLLVHATWTYHRSSDIIFPYGFYRPGVPMANQTKSVDEWMKGKTKLIAWFASNCNRTSWPRYDFVKELAKYIPVDVYGACGNLICKPNTSPTCLVDVMRQYKFYLALENSECEDYITEKLWHKPLMQGVVPIVYGPRRKVYEELLPPNSFVYIGDYQNVKHLADHLKLLNSKPELYVKYFEWQYNGSVGVPKRMGEHFNPLMFCNLIPVIQQVKGGALKKVPLREHKFYESCRKSHNYRNRPESAFGLGKWYPW